MKLCVYHTGSTCATTGKGKPPDDCLKRGCDGRILHEPPVECVKSGTYQPKKERCNDVLQMRSGHYVCGTSNVCRNKGDVLRKGLHIRICNEPIVDTFCETGKAKGCLG